MEVREISTRNLIIGALLGTLLMCLLCLGAGSLQNSVAKEERIISDGIEVYVNGARQNAVGLSDSLFSVKRGDLVELIIPYADYLEGRMTLLLLVYLSGVEAYVGDRQVYSYGMDRVEADVMVGSGYHFINLPEKLNGQNVLIKIYVNEDNAFTSIDEINCVSVESSYRFFAGKTMLGLLVGVFLSALGIVLIVAGLIATFFEKSFARLPLIGFFSLFMGIWSFSGQKTFQLFEANLERWTVHEYGILYLSPIPLFWMIFLMRKHEKDWRLWVLLADIIEYTVFVGTCFFLHLFNIMRLPQSLPIFHKQGAIVLLVAMVVGVFLVHNKTRSESLFMMGVFILCGAIGLDLIRFNVQKYIWPNASLLKNSLLPMATLVFILTLVLSYIIHLYDMLMTRTEKEMLTQLAYHDNLTGLYNRAKATERLEELTASKEAYCIISLDVNGLKYVNDTFGHGKGDEMLLNFSHNLHEAFLGVGKCYRMGGDEFSVIVRQRNFKSVYECLGKLERLQKKEIVEGEVLFDASYGVAYSREVEDASPEKIYALADDRMYQMKMSKHNSRLARENKANQDSGNAQG